MTAVTIPAQQTGPDAPPTPAAAPAATSQRPTWLPEKFNSPEDFAKSYAELEKKLGGGSTQAQATPTQTQQATQQTTTTQQQATQTQQAPNPLEAFEKEYAETGQFKPESYDAMAKLGLSRAMVDQYVSGIKAQTESARAEVYNVAGGEQSFQRVVQWAQTGLSESEKNAYNDVVKSGNIAAVKLAVAGMSAKYQQANGRQPNLIGGSAPRNTGPEAFSSWAQVTKAMSDARYDSDPAYRAEVEQRLAASNI